ncbi:hypothetical protein [Aquimarina rhabdastrellae]
MKKLYSLFIIGTLLLSCNTDDDSGNGNNTGQGENTAPSIPTLIFPENNLLCSNIALGFEWSDSEDREGDHILYQVEIARDDMFTDMLFSIITPEPHRNFNFEKGTVYYWRVKAKDNKRNESSYSEVRSFITEPEVGINTIPQTPKIISPSLGQSVVDQTVVLEWESTDGDGDPIVYDIYFGETNPPVLLIENIEQTVFGINLSPDKTYYWRVIAKDDREGVAIGRVWHFNTN